ncbi:hypothetical protein HDC94_001078 [Leifsonia sp. AK011]|uniref:hypothetical protein n=1 Tax=Leifsonia sp. AK011 TaxID=2723075 RepID=UPI0015CEBDEC|nr:hypothetical protein [Leifsonia sp. AK011]NYF09922.1 hypothetical protein [Leifsonia sp. AK011]
MSTFIQPHETISDAWIALLDVVQADASGTLTNVMVTVADPLSADDAQVRASVDDTLVGKGRWGVGTVASTIFPEALYTPPSFSWSPDLPPEKARELDEAAKSLYTEYIEMLPELKMFRDNRQGTYFSRMVTFPGKESGGVNQLADRIHYLRKARLAGQRTHNADDMTVSGDGEIDQDENLAFGLQEYASTDRRQISFPCLVHIDFTLVNGMLSLTAIYRHWYLVTRGYGNLVGLARLLAFVAQQTGSEVGELVVIAGYANAERKTYGGKRGIDSLLAKARLASQPSVAAATVAS